MKKVFVNSSSSDLLFLLFPALTSLFVLTGLNIWLNLLILATVSTLLFMLAKKRYDYSYRPEQVLVGTALALIFITQAVKPMSIISYVLCIAFTAFLLTSYFLNLFKSKYNSQKKDFWTALVMKVLKLTLVIASILLTINSLGSHYVWLPIISFILLTISGAHDDNWEFEWQESFSGITSIVMIVIGIINSAILFSDAVHEKIMSMDVIYAKIFIGIVIVFLLYSTVRQFVIRARHKKEYKLKEIARKNEEAKAEINRQKNAEKSARELEQKKILKEKILNVNDGLDLEDLITVSNIKRQVVWNNQMNMAIEALRELAKDSYNDEEIDAVDYQLKEIKAFISEKKREKDLENSKFDGEDVLFEKLKEIESFYINKEKEEEERRRWRLEAHKEKLLIGEFPDISKLITVSNIKRTIVWKKDLSIILDVMKGVAETSFNDEEIKNVRKLCQIITDFIDEKKGSKQEGAFEASKAYVNEVKLRQMLEEISALTLPKR